MTHSIDQTIAHTLQKGSVCHIFESQQSQPSLCTQVQTQMERRGYRNVVIKMCEITNHPQVEHLWETCLIKTLWAHLNTHGYSGSHAGSLEWISRWLATTQQLSPAQKLARFASELLLNELSEQPLIIFIEQIEQLLLVPNAIETLFHWIDYCTELRETYLTYHHINFALFSTDPLTKLAFQSLPTSAHSTLFQQRNALVQSVDRSTARSVTLPSKLPSIWPFPLCAQSPKNHSKAQLYAQHKRQPNILAFGKVCSAALSHSPLIPAALPAA